MDDIKSHKESAATVDYFLISYFLTMGKSTIRGRRGGGKSAHEIAKKNALIAMMTFLLSPKMQ